MYLILPRFARHRYWDSEIVIAESTTTPQAKWAVTFKRVHLVMKARKGMSGTYSS